MSSNRRNVSIAPHTEYARTHVQCVGCGNTVPRDGVEETDGLCVRCQERGE